MNGKRVMNFKSTTFSVILILLVISSSILIPRVESQSPYARRIYPVWANPTVGASNENEIYYNMTLHKLYIVKNTGLEEITTGGAGGDALTTNPLSQFASTTSAQLFGIISNETGGTGNLVGSVSPTFTGTVVTSNLTVSGTINGVKVYRALLTQTGTNAPVATVLENNLGGTVVWARTTIGTYTATLTGAFTVNKTWFVIQSPAIENGGITASFNRTSADVLTLSVTFFDGGAPEFAGKDDGLLGTPIEISVYP